MHSINDFHDFHVIHIHVIFSLKGVDSVKNRSIMMRFSKEKLNGRLGIEGGSINV